MRFSRSRAQQAGAVALAAASLGFLLQRCACSPQVPFIRQSASAPWIMPASPVSAELQQWGRQEIPVARFEKRFRAQPPFGRVLLRVRALRRFQAHLNGDAVEGASGDGARWRHERVVDLTSLLRPGLNQLRVDVENAHGPPLLSLRMEGLAEPLRSDPTWSVRIDDGGPQPAIVADDTRPNPASFGVETPLEALARCADTALLLFLLGALGLLLGRRFAGDRAVALLPGAALLAASAGWLALFAAKVGSMPLQIGFDARHHLAYVEFLRAQRTLPLATDGWSTFHPPLFYLVSLAAGASPLALKLLPHFAGLAAVWAAWALTRRLFPDDARLQLFAVVFAAALPMNLYSSSYFSNESTHTLLATLSLLAAVDLLLVERTSATKAALLGLLLGLAALVKFTVLLVVPVVLFFLVAKWALVEHAPAARAVRLFVASAAPFLGVAGWFYARNWIAFGDPLVANWGDMPGTGHLWWQQPGFHTLAYYTGFGQALVHPYLSGFHSFWDSVYSTFWGDGFVAGRVLAADRHPFWNYDLMSLGYLVALPATGLLALGTFEVGRRALRDPDPRRRAAFSFLATTAWVVGLGFLYLTLRLPHFSQAKATYTLVMVGPFAVFFALGAGRCDAALARWLPVRAAFYGWLAMFAATLFLSFAA
jgi:hypothetical protein